MFSVNRVVKGMLIIFCCAMVFYSDACLAAEQPYVAVLDFVGKNISGDDSAIITDFFRNELVRTGKFHVLDRHNIKSILDEQAVQMSGITDVANAVQVGKLTNARYVFVGTYSRIDNLFILNVEMVNVQTGKIEKSASRSKEEPTAKDKLDLARYLAYNFSGFGVGYELFWDGDRVGFEPEWSMEQAASNLKWNRNTYPEKKVEGFYNGVKMP